MSKSKDVCAAFERTRPHPADPGVRLTADKEDLIALQHDDVKAIIFENAMPFGNGCEVKEMPEDLLHSERKNFHHVSALRWGGYKGTGTRSDPLPAAITNAADSMMPLFDIASGRGFFEKIKPDKSIRIRLGKGGASSPHIDGDGLNNEACIRMICNYTHNERMGTHWLPNGFSTDEVRQLQEEFKTTSDHESLIEKYNIQSVKPGDVLFIKTQGAKKKGYNSDGAETAGAYYKDEELLVHYSAPEPAKKEDRHGLDEMFSAVYPG